MNLKSIFVAAAIAAAPIPSVAGTTELTAYTKRKCMNDMFAVDIRQALDRNTFFAYGRYSVGDPFPLLIIYTNDSVRPISTGSVNMHPGLGVIDMGERKMKMDNGFQQNVLVLKVGDKTCAKLWEEITD